MSKKLEGKMGISQVRKVFQEKQMNELLAIALDAHGGLDRWNKLKGLIAGMSISETVTFSVDQDVDESTVNTPGKERNRLR